MQLISSIGTFSVFALTDHPGALVVRAASEIELARLRRHALPDLMIERAPTAETAFQAIVARDEWSYAVESLVDEIDDAAPVGPAPAAKAG